MSAGRVRDLKANVLSRLEADSSVSALLNGVDSQIVPAYQVEEQHRHDGSVPDVSISVTVVTSSSDRENRQERKNHVVQAEIQIRSQTLHKKGVEWLDTVQDAVASVLTSHPAGWTARGMTGGTPEPLWDDSINRYRTAQRFDIQHWG